ncbi:hypothetical protein GCM10009116_08160 [Brevundimonas basaltis]
MRRTLASKRAVAEAMPAAAMAWACMGGSREDAASMALEAEESGNEQGERGGLRRGRDGCIVGP